MQKKKAVTLLIIAAMFLVQAADVFLIKSNQTVFADYIVAKCIQTVLLFVAAKHLKFNIKRRCLDTYGSLFELLYGFLFSNASLLVIYGAELIYFKIVGYSGLNISFEAPNGQGNFAAVAYIAALAINVVFKEIFRGFTIAQLGEGHRFRAVNFIQALIFTAFGSLSILHMQIEGSFDKYDIVEIVMIIGSSVLTTFVGSMKWGYYYRVNGSSWMAIADHFINNFVLTCVYFSQDRLPDKWLLAKSLVIQIVSCLIFIPFYYRRDRANAEIAKEAKLRREVLSSMKKGYTEGDRGTVDEMLLLMNDTNQNKKFGISADNEIQSLDKSPAELSKEFFESSFADSKIEESPKKQSAPQVNSEAEISKLTKAFFERQIK